MTQSLRQIVARTNFLLLSLAVLGVAMAHSSAFAQAERSAPDAAPAGSLLLRVSAGTEYVTAPRVSAEFELQVSGLLAQATVRQSFLNPSDDRIEAVYVFPLPEGAAVERLRIRIGERSIESRVLERGTARATFDAARHDGVGAALLEMERPNIFTLSVADIGPGETVHVAFDYRETLSPVDGRIALRLPLVVAPRYIPAPEGRNVGYTAVPDMPGVSRISPPVRHPAAGPANPVRISVLLDAGAPVSAIGSPSHDITVDRTESGRHSVELRSGAVAADRDFVLRWTPVAGNAPHPALFKESTQGQHYYRLMLLPPRDDSIPAATAREIVFVVDTSGSMHGAALDQAKAALRHAIAGLGPNDRFNLLRFASDVESLFPSARTVDQRARAAALRFIDGLEADGGTNLMPALETVLQGVRDPGRIRQVVLLTDGALANERELFAAIRDRLGDSRLFTVGIGSAPNAYLLKGAARYGRGSHVYLDGRGDAAARMAALFERLARPVVTDITLRLADAAGNPVHGEIWPRRIGDLHAGDPVSVSIRAPREAVVAIFEGTLRGQPWRLEQPLDPDAADRPGIAALWAREKISGLMDAMLETNDAERVELRKAILALGLVHGQVTKFTSLVAVETEASDGNGGEEALRRAVPLNLPDGWSYEKIFDTAAGPDQTLYLPLDLQGRLSPAAPSVLRGVPWRDAEQDTARPPGTLLKATAGDGASGVAEAGQPAGAALFDDGRSRPTENMALWLAAIMGMALLLLLGATGLVRRRR